MKSQQPLTRIRRVWVFLVVCTILMNACGATQPATQVSDTPTIQVATATSIIDRAPTSTPVPSTPTVAKTLPPPAEDPFAATKLASTILANGDTVAMVEVLARAGILTITTAQGSIVQEVGGEPSAIFFSDEQVSNMAREANALMGTLGTDLDELAPVTDIPPLSYILASYVLDAQTFGGAFSRELLKDAPLNNPPQAIFPTVVLTLFLADVLAASNDQATRVYLTSYTPANQSSIQPMRLAAKVAPAGICGAMTGALENVLERILSSVLGSFIGSIVAGAAVRYGMEYLSDALSNLPIIRQIRQALAVVAMVTQFGSLLRNWSVRLTSDGSTYHYTGGGGSPNSGTFTATVDAGGTMRVPPAVKECAALARITIPEITGAEGSQVVWTPGAGWGTHASETNKESVVAADQTAKLNFGTASETELDHGNGTTTPHPVSMNVSIKRNDVEQIKGVIARAVSDLIGIPGIGGLVQDVVGSGVDALADTLMNPQAQATITVESEVHPWEARFTQSGSCGGQISLDANSCAGLAGPWTLRVTCTGQINGFTTTLFAFDASQPIPPPVNVEWQIKGNTLDGIPLEPGTTCGDDGCVTVTKLSDAPMYSVRAYGDGYDRTFEMGVSTGGADLTLDWAGSVELKTGPILQSKGTTTLTHMFMGKTGQSNDSVDFTLVPRPDQPLCTR